MVEVVIMIAPWSHFEGWQKKRTSFEDCDRQETRLVQQVCGHAVPMFLLSVLFFLLRGR